jgi:hypothetical protein
MPLLRKIEPAPGSPDYLFFCPGCQCAHGVWTTNRNTHTGATWSFNNDMAKPTFTPSLKIQSANERGPTCCHVIITNGILNFCGDSTHLLTGKAIPMQDF